MVGRISSSYQQAVCFDTVLPSSPYNCLSPGSELVGARIRFISLPSEYTDMGLAVQAVEKQPLTFGHASQSLALLAFGLNTVKFKL